MTKFKFVVKSDAGDVIAEKVTTRSFTHAVIGTRVYDVPGQGSAGQKMVLRWCSSQRTADASVKEFHDPSWQGMWNDIVVKPVDSKEELNVPTGKAVVG